MFSFVSETSEDRDVARQHARLDDLEHERREGRGIGSDRGGCFPTNAGRGAELDGEVGAIPRKWPRSWNSAGWQ